MVRALPLVLVLAAMLGMWMPTAAIADFGGASVFMRGTDFDGPTDLAVNAGGTIAAVWTTDDGLTYDPDHPPGAIEVMIRRADGRQSRRLQVGSVGITSVTDVFVDELGTVTIVYQQDGTGVTLVRCSLRGCRSVLLDGDGTLSDAAMDSAGRVLVMWRGTTRLGPRLRFAVAVRGRVGRPQTLGETGGQPAVAASGTRFIALWPTPGAMRTAVLRANGTMTRPRVLDEASDPGIPVDPVVRGTRRGFVAAWHPAGVSDSVWIFDLDRDGRRIGFDQAPMISGRLVLSVAASRRALVTTAGGCPAPIGVALRESPAERMYTRPAMSLPGTEGACFRHAVMDTKGRATIAWSEGADHVPRLALTGPTGGFGGAVSLDCRPTPSTACEGPLFATAGNLTVALWSNGTDLLFASSR
jgi:hypothetical protein